MKHQIIVDSEELKNQLSIVRNVAQKDLVDALKIQLDNKEYSLKGGLVNHDLLRAIHVHRTAILKTFELMLAQNSAKDTSDEK